MIKLHDFRIRQVCLNSSFSWQIFIIEPKYSSGVMIVALIQGSSILIIWEGSGMLDGFCKFTISFFICVLYK